MLTRQSTHAVQGFSCVYIVTLEARNEAHSTPLPNHESNNLRVPQGGQHQTSIY
jgi:hypothetical protein